MSSLVWACMSRFVFLRQPCQLMACPCLWLCEGVVSALCSELGVERPATGVDSLSLSFFLFSRTAGVDSLSLSLSFSFPEQLAVRDVMIGEVLHRNVFDGFRAVRWLVDKKVEGVHTRTDATRVYQRLLQEGVVAPLSDGTAQDITPVFCDAVVMYSLQPATRAASPPPEQLLRRDTLHALKEFMSSEIEVIIPPFPVFFFCPFWLLRAVISVCTCVRACVLYHDRLKRGSQETVDTAYFAETMEFGFDNESLDSAHMAESLEFAFAEFDGSSSAEISLQLPAKVAGDGVVVVPLKHATG
jgi:hypothetical protein